MESYAVYIRIEGQTKRHKFLVPAGVPVRTLLSKCKEKIPELRDVALPDIQIVQISPKGQSIEDARFGDSMQIGDGTDIVISINALDDKIQYLQDDD